MASPSTSSSLSIVLRKELLELGRDWHSLFLGILLPALLYPLLLVSYAKGTELLKTMNQQKVCKIATIGSSAALTRSLMSDSHIKLTTLPGGDIDEALTSGRVDIVVICPPDFGKDIDEERRAPVINVIHGRQEVTGLSSMQAAFDRFKQESLQTRLERHGIQLPVRYPLTFKTGTSQTDAQRSASWVSKSVPLMLVLFVASAMLFPALDLVSGERERGTLAALLSTPTDMSTCMRGKFLAILLLGLTAAFLLMAGLWLTVGSSALVMFDAVGRYHLQLDSGNFAVASVLAVPLVAFLASIAVWLACYCQDYKQGSLIFSILILLLGCLSCACMCPAQLLPPAITLVPVSNISIAMAEALNGRFAPIPAIVSATSTCFYAFLMCKAAVGMFSDENKLFRIEFPLIHLRSRIRLVAIYLVVVFVAYFHVSQLARAWNPLIGIILSQVLVIALPALGLARLLKKPVATTFGFQRARLSQYAGAFFLAPMCVVFSALLEHVQELILPVPEEFAKTFVAAVAPVDQSVWINLLAVAVTPAVCEEILFRGVVLSLLSERIHSPKRLILIVGVIFGAFHSSSYRFVGTCGLGFLLTALRLKTGSIYPCMLLHAGINATSVILVRSGIAKLPWQCEVAAWFVGFLALYLLSGGRLGTSKTSGDPAGQDSTP